MFEGLAEIWNSFFTWAKENGDVLGTIGFLFAMTTVVITNGKLILQRMRTDQIQGVSQGTITVPAASSISAPAIIDAPPERPDYGNKVAIAVLPPSEIGEYGDHFALGLLDDLVADLQRAGFAMPDPNAVSKLVKADAESSKIARDLAVEHILSTNIRRQDNKIRVTAQLTGPRGAVSWSDRFNAVGDDLMAIQESVAGKIASAVARQVDTSDTLRNPQSGAVYKTREEAIRAIASPKSRLTALLLCSIIIGIFGAHRFYVGRPFTGLLYLLTLGLFCFGWIIDIILIATGLFADGKGRPVRIWLPDPLKTLK